MAPQPVYAPPPSPPPPSPPVAEVQDGSVVVTGTRVRRPNLESASPVTVVNSEEVRLQGTTRPGDQINSLPQVQAGQGYVRSPDNRERYTGEEVAAVLAVADAPVSTFSIDVDTGSYANVRRMLNAGSLPPQAAVRTEEMLNYFRYDYPAPRDRARPFTVSADMVTTPWNRNTRLLRVGPARLRSAARRSGRRPTWSSWSTFRDRWTSRTNCRSCNARWPCSPTG